MKPATTIISGGVCLSLALLMGACSDSSSSSSAGSGTGSGTGVANASAISTSLEGRSFCESQERDQLRVATAFPLTGDAVDSGPAATAGTVLAVKDIKAAGGVLGKPPVLATVEDSGDSEDLQPSTAAANQIVTDRDQVVIGPLTAVPTLNMGYTLARGCATVIALSDLGEKPGLHTGNVFQYSATDEQLGDALADQLKTDQRTKVAFITYDDAYDQGVRDAAVTRIRADGGDVVYGGKLGEISSALEDTQFPQAARQAAQSGADAYVVLAYGESSDALANLVSAGVDPSQIYLAGANVVGYGNRVPRGSLEGATGVAYGAEPDASFASRVESATSVPVDPVIAAQTYDATVLAALAAEKAKSTQGDAIRESLPAVSGADGGTACSTFADCSKLLQSGEAVHYTGVSGSKPFDSEQNASSGAFGIYQYDRANKPTRTTTINVGQAAGQ
jgi:neutral amino acid transport system substrate-binding protein